MIDDLIITNLKIVKIPDGDVMHVLKATENSFNGFGEAYFSHIRGGAIKAWKRHKKMTLNLTVPYGKIKFVLFDDRDMKNWKFQEVIISKENYQRLAIPPMIWMGFQGLSKQDSLLINIANIEHDPTEIEKINIQQIKFDWRK